LREVEGRMVELLISKPVDSLLKEEESELGSLRNKKIILLDLEEYKWRLKSRAVWLQEGDNISKKFLVMQTTRETSI
jgi:hypothetical protein